ncbi:site-specific integrase [Acidiferrobacter sp.]|uniref:site-specific integrase n=1 Tax=Acidiferrobacter sp. TaxID=1872107 RepID=UPI00262B7E73|nr:site-specific integrase [Acidiferrobacter sp.]
MMKPTRSRPTQRAGEGWFSNTVFDRYADAYVQYLASCGYAAATVTGYFGSVAHFAHWFAQQRAGVADFGEALIDRFLDQHLPHCRCASRCRRTRIDVRPALRHFLDMLRRDEACPQKISTIPAAIAAELEAFDGHLADVRGLAASTRGVHMRHLLGFLTDRFGVGPIAVSALTPVDVARFMTRYTAGWAPGSIKAARSSLRSYFRFKAIQGKPMKSLIAVLPQVAQWRLVRLPQCLSATEIKRLLSAFDRSTATGKRDYAITRCLIDLGLRRAEVAHLQLDDVDWQAGTLRIHGKGKRIDILPLPEATGHAITDYLRAGRPQTSRRELFVRHRPPNHAPADLDIVRNAVRYAAKRCGLERRIRGTHILRHTVACRMVQGGAPFKEIADLLRHRNLDTTTIYAKVHLPALARVALPWPGRQT